MIRTGLENAGHDGWEAVFVLGDACYYSRFGFSVQAAKGYFSLDSGEHFMMLQLDPRKILTSGRLVYDRSATNYPPVIAFQRVLNCPEARARFASGSRLLAPCHLLNDGPT
jgi:hypothetical protein